MFLKSIAAALLLIFASQPMFADELDAIKQRGVLRVGVKTDYFPFGFLDSKKAIIGLEPDLAADAANKLGVKLELVPVTTNTRLALLKSGSIDLVAATMTETLERREEAELIEPFYYSSHVNLLLPRGSPIKDWESLKGKEICGVEGSWFNEVIEENLETKVIKQTMADDGLKQLRAKKCVGFLFDEAYILGKLEAPEWSNEFEMPFHGHLRAPWAMAVKKNETRLREFMETLTVGWMKAGRIVELEKKWGLTPSEYALGMARRYHGK